MSSMLNPKRKKRKKKAKKEKRKEKVCAFHKAFKMGLLLRKKATDFPLEKENKTKWD